MFSSWNYFNWLYIGNQLFDRLKKEKPNEIHKIIPVSGDIAEEGLGLPVIERQFLIERVSVIFHVAANVRFDDSLKEAVFTNLRSTRDVCILAANMKQLVVNVLHLFYNFWTNYVPTLIDLL